MKPFLSFIFISSLLITHLSAQPVAYSPPKTNVNKGSWQVGLRDGHQGGNLIGFRNTLQLHSGYYLVDKLAVGLSGTWAREGVSSFAYHDLTAGPYIRYQFTRTRLSPFIDASYQVGRRIAGEGSGFSFTNMAMNSGQISPGISIGVTRFLRAELNYHFQWIYAGYGTEYIGQPQFGITYLFNNK